MTLSREEHIERHKKLHKSLDELVADMISQTKMLPSDTTVMELIEWSHKQTLVPGDPG